MGVGVEEAPAEAPGEPPQPLALEQGPEDAAKVEPPQGLEAEAEWEDVVVAPLPPSPSRSLGRTAVRAPAAVAETPGQDRGKRWLMAGAARRGRAGKHWSTRQR